jgi:protoporphyrin/coproporphyrin ferrochelatase
MGRDRSAFLLISFGGPEGMEEVEPFLQAVTQGRSVPPDRIREVAKHYERFDGVSPINEECRRFLSAVEAEFHKRDVSVSIYWGNRFSQPFLKDVVRQMTADGVTHAVASPTCVFDAPASWDAYKMALESALEEFREAGEVTPQVELLPSFHDEPEFLETVADGVIRCLDEIPLGRRAATHVMFSAHSLPEAMAARSPYAEQFESCSAIVAKRIGLAGSGWSIAYQSRSGPPHQPWLRPDIFERTDALVASGQVSDIVVVPIGFPIRHMEVVYDLDVELAAHCKSLGLNMFRSATPDSDPRMIAMTMRRVENRLETMKNAGGG